MQLRKSIVRPERLEDDEDYAEAGPRPTIKPRLPRLMKAHAVPFKLQPAAFPSLPLAALFSSYPGAEKDGATSDLEIESPVDNIDVAQFDDVDQNAFATKVDWQNSNNLLQGVALADDEPVTWSDLGLATQLLIWTKFRENIKSIVAAELLGLTAEQHRAIESLQYMSEIHPLSEGVLHKGLDYEFRQGVRDYNKPHTHSKVAEKYLNDLVLEGHLRHPYQYEVERGKKFLLELGLVNYLVDPKTTSVEKRRTLARMKRPAPLSNAFLDTDNYDSGYDSMLAAQKQNPSATQIPSTGMKRSAEEAFQGSDLIQNTKAQPAINPIFRTGGLIASGSFFEADASLAPPSPIRRAADSAFAVINDYVVEPVQARSASGAMRRRAITPVVHDAAIAQLIESSHLDANDDVATTTATQELTLPQPRRNRDRAARWIIEAWKELKSTEETRQWNRGGVGDEDDLAYSSTTDAEHVKDSNLTQTLKSRSRVSVETMESKCSINHIAQPQRRKLVLKIKKKDGTAVVRKEKTTETTSKEWQYKNNPHDSTMNFLLLRPNTDSRVQPRDKILPNMNPGKRDIGNALSVLPQELAHVTEPNARPHYVSTSISTNNLDELDHFKRISSTESQGAELGPTRKVTPLVNSTLSQVSSIPPTVNPQTTLVHQFKKKIGNLIDHWTTNAQTSPLVKEGSDNGPLIDGQTGPFSRRSETFQAGGSFSAPPDEPTDDLQNLLEKLGNRLQSSPVAPPYSPISDNSSLSRRGSELSNNIKRSDQPLALHLMPNHIELRNDIDTATAAPASIDFHHDSSGLKLLVVEEDTRKKANTLLLRLSLAKTLEDLDITKSSTEGPPDCPSPIQKLSADQPSGTGTNLIQGLQKLSHTSAAAAEKPDTQRSAEYLQVPILYNSPIDISTPIPQGVQSANTQVLQGFNASKQAIGTAPQALNAGKSATIPRNVDLLVEGENQNQPPTVPNGSPSRSDAEASSAAPPKPDQVITLENSNVVQTKKRSATPRGPNSAKRVDAGKKRGPYNTKRRKEEEAKRLKREQEAGNELVGNAVNGSESPAQQ